jgi:hypothetical protein
MKTYVIRKINTALNIGSLKITHNGLQIGDVADFGTQNYLQPLNLI